MKGFLFPWSDAVVAAADEIVTTLLLRSPRNPSSYFDGVHWRAGDKAAADPPSSQKKAKGGRVGKKTRKTISPFLRLRSLDADELFKRIYAFLGGEKGGATDDDSGGGGSALYVATDASPETLRRGRGAVALLHFWPGLLSAHGGRGGGAVRRILAKHCPVRGLYEACSAGPGAAASAMEYSTAGTVKNTATMEATAITTTTTTTTTTTAVNPPAPLPGNPFFTLAVEMAVLERARRFVASERSNPSRRVALRRLQRQQQQEQEQEEEQQRERGTTHNEQRRKEGKDDDDDDDDDDDGDARAVRYLHSSLVVRLRGRDLGLAEWERASIRSDEAAVATLDESATKKAAARYVEAGAILKKSCLRAHGWRLAATMCPAAAETTSSSSTEMEGEEELSTLRMSSFRDCCDLCAAANARGSDCTAWQWSPSAAVPCSLRTGDIEIELAVGGDEDEETAASASVCGVV